MEGVPDRALVYWTPGTVHAMARVWVYRDNMLQTIADTNEPNPGSIVTYDGDITTGLNLTQGPHYHLINDATWQWLTKEENGPFKRKEGYYYLYRLYQGQTLAELMAHFEESTTGSDTEGLATDGEGKEGVALLDDINIKF